MTSSSTAYLGPRVQELLALVGPMSDYCRSEDLIMRVFFALLIVAALCACPKKNVGEPAKVEDAATKVEDASSEDVVVMDAVVVEVGG